MEGYLSGTVDTVVAWRRGRERVMYSGGSTYGARRVVVIPAHAGIPAAPRIWIPAYAGMTFHRSIHAPGGVFNMYNTL